MSKNVLYCVFLVLLSACSMSSLRQMNQTAERLLWTHPDSCIIYLQMCNTHGAADEDMQVRQLLMQAAWMRLTRVPHLQDWNQSLAYFSSVGNRMRIGQCVYYKGVCFSLLQQPDSCQYYLSRAITFRDVLTPVYLGMAYYRLGVMEEENEQYKSAFSYFTQALPYLQQTGNRMLLSCCYRDLARMSYSLRQDSLATVYFAQATQLAEQLQDSILSLDIAIQQTGNALSIDSTHLLHLYQALGRESMAHQLQEKESELTILQEHLMEEKSLRTQRQLAGGLLFALIASALLILLLIYVRWQREQYRHQLTVMEQGKLKQELENKREVLQSRLRERVMMKSESVNWDAFYEEFDVAYDGLLSRLTNRYPDLTDIDIRYIVLTCMHFNTSDICLLLNHTKRTIYNRRQILKQRLGLTTEDLDDWLRAL